MAGSLDNYGWSNKLNVAWGIDSEHPLTVPVNSSLISTSSRIGDDPNVKSRVQRAQILTVLPTDAFNNLPEGILPSDCFRPSYFGNNKPIRSYQQQLDYSFLKELPPIDEPAYGAYPTNNVTADLVVIEDWFKRPWIRKGLGWTSRYIHPVNNMAEYYFYYNVNYGALYLNLDLTTSAEKTGKTAEQITALNNHKKKTLFQNFVQLGIDNYGPFEAGSRGNPADGGIFQGLILPIIVAGMALNYAPMLDICQKSGDYLYSQKPGGGNYGLGNIPPDYLFFQELGRAPREPYAL